MSNSFGKEQNMNRLKVIAVSTVFVFSTVPCWAQTNSQENSVPLREVQQVVNYGEKALSGGDTKTDTRILVSEAQTGKREALPNPMPEPIKEKRGALPNPMPEPVDSKLLPQNPKP
jgi:hypothetical protein